MIPEAWVTVPRAVGPGDILTLLRRHGPLTRAEIIDATGMSRMTLTQRLAPLLDEKIIVTGGAAASTGGRRASKLSFNHDYGFFAVESMETTRARTAITDLDGRVLYAKDSPADVKDGPQKSLELVRRSISEAIIAAGVPRSSLRGIGIALPGPIDPLTQRPNEPPIMPGWDGFPVAETLADTYDVPVVVENDANAMALGVQRAVFPRTHALELIKCSTGIGSGLVIDGELFDGVDGGAGDIGHIHVDAATTRRCRCGANGCLAAAASGWAVATELDELGISAKTGYDVRKLLELGDPDANRLVEKAGRHIGRVAASIVSILNPDVLVLSGDMASTALLAGVRHSLYEHTLPRATKSLRTVLDKDENSTVRGVGQALADQVFAAPALNERFAA